VSGSVFLPRLGFRSIEGVRLADPVTVTRENDQGLRVMHLVSTDRGTELAFEIRDKEREGVCMIGAPDNSWMREMRIALRNDAGAAIPHSQRGGGGYSMGMHEYGFYRANSVFETLAAETRHVTLEVRGPLGEWDVPLELASIEETAAPRAIPIGAEQERHGITVRISSFVATGSSTILEVEATALPPLGTILGIGSEFVRNDDNVFVLVDEHRRRFVEQPSVDLANAGRADGSHTVAEFPQLPPDSRHLTLIVPSVVVEEPGITLELELPVTDPLETHFGSYPVRIGSARVSDEVRFGMGEQPKHGLEVKFAPAGWFDGGRVIRPRRMSVDGVTKYFGWGRRADPEALTLTAPLDDGADARMVTLIDGTVKVRGPWEIRFARP
jgi:hypothetical protein